MSSVNFDRRQPSQHVTLADLTPPYTAETMMTGQSSIDLRDTVPYGEPVQQPSMSSLFENANSLASISSSEPARLLLVGPDPSTHREWKQKLSTAHWCVVEARSGAAAWEKLLEESFELMLLDPNLPDLDGAEFERLIRVQFPGLQIIILASSCETASPATVSATSAPRTPENHSRVLLRPESTRRQTFTSSAKSTGSQSGWYELVGSSDAMQRVYHAAQLVARRTSTVLIQGESGTGKDLLARSIHASSPRERQPFVVINCAAIPEALLEAELFGYTKGAFTGAAQSKIGRIHLAHGGTLFLDEIGDMPYPLQSKILRFLEQGEVQRIGGTDTLKVDCRIIAATNADLKNLVKASRFREDLFYRLAVFPILLPSLRDRMEDLDALIDTFVSKFCPGGGMSDAARRLLTAHDWPGNVRELRNVVERASIYADDRRFIEAEDVCF